MKGALANENKLNTLACPKQLHAWRQVILTYLKKRILLMKIRYENAFGEFVLLVIFVYESNGRLVFLRASFTELKTKLLIMSDI